MKKNKKSKGSSKEQATTPPKVKEPDDDGEQPKFGGLDMKNFKKNMGCGS